MVLSTFSSIIEGETSLFRWIQANSSDGSLSDDKQCELPDLESKNLSWPTLDKINVVSGMLDGVIGAEADDADEIAKRLFDLLENFLDDNGEDIDIKLGRLYGFLIEHSTITYIDSFIDLLAQNQSNKGLLNTCIKIAMIFASEGIHREAVKFGIAIMGLFSLSDDDLELFMTLGLADEFSKFISLALARAELNENIFTLAKATHGWGRVNYIDRLEPLTDEIKSWLIYEGYNCDIGINHVALECVTKGDLLGHIKTNGWSEELFDATSQLLNGLIDPGPTDGIDGYEDSKEVLELFIEESRHQNMDIDRFYLLCEIFFYIRDYYENEGWSKEEKESLVQKIGDTAWRKGIDWESIIFEDVSNYKARTIAKALGIDIWDKLFELAQNDEEFDNWYALTQTDDPTKYKKLCELAEQKLPLAKIATGPKDELGLGREFNPHMNLTMIVQNLNRFEEIMGVELVKTALNSPVTNNRNMALRVVESWKEVPREVVEILQKNRDIEPYKDAIQKYDALLRKSESAR